MEEYIWCISEKPLLDRLLAQFNAHKIKYVYPVPLRALPKEFVYELKRNYDLSEASIKKISILIRGNEEDIQKAKDILKFVTKTSKLVKQLNRLYEAS
jgi:replicative superfamily II helicase